MIKIYFIENYMELPNFASCCLKTVNTRMCHRLDTYQCVTEIGNVVATSHILKSSINLTIDSI